MHTAFYDVRKACDAGVIKVPTGGCGVLFIIIKVYKPLLTLSLETLS